MDRGQIKKETLCRELAYLELKNGSNMILNWGLDKYNKED